MSITVRVTEQSTTGGQSSSLDLEFLEERVPLRELIRRYVYERVAERNARLLNAPPPKPVHGRSLRRPAPEGPQLADCEPEYQRALAGFEARGFLVLVDDHQIAGLDEQVQLRMGTRVTFLRLIPLAGG